jgi:hypothetical protein
VYIFLFFDILIASEVYIFLFFDILIA